MGAPLRVVTAPTPSPKSTSFGPSWKWMPDQVMVSMYVPPRKRVPPSVNMMAPDLEDVLKLIRRWSLFNYEESMITHMPDLYLNCFRLPVAARSEQYSISLPIYMNKEDF